MLFYNAESFIIWKFRAKGALSVWAFALTWSLSFYSLTVFIVLVDYSSFWTKESFCFISDFKFIVIAFLGYASNTKNLTVTRRKISDLWISRRSGLPNKGPCSYGLWVGWLFVLTDRGLVDYASVIKNFGAANFKSAGYFGSRWQPDLIWFVGTTELPRTFMVPCDSKFQSHACRSPCPMK